MVQSGHNFQGRLVVLFCALRTAHTTSDQTGHRRGDLQEHLTNGDHAGVVRAKVGRVVHLDARGVVVVIDVVEVGPVVLFRAKWHTVSTASITGSFLN